MAILERENWNTGHNQFVVVAIEPAGTNFSYHHKKSFLTEINVIVFVRPKSQFFNGHVALIFGTVSFHSVLGPRFVPCVVFQDLDDPGFRERINGMCPYKLAWNQFSLLGVLGRFEDFVEILAV